MIGKYKNYRKASILYLDRTLEENNTFLHKTDLKSRVAEYCKIKGIDFTIVKNLHSFLEQEFRKSKKKPKQKKQSPQERKAEYNKYLKSAKWKSIRLYILEDRNHKCERCGSFPSLNNLHVHHKTYERIFNELPTDLELLCKDCHEKEHGIKPKKKSNSFDTILKAHNSTISRLEKDLLKKSITKLEYDTKIKQANSKFKAKVRTNS